MPSSRSLLGVVGDVAGRKSLGLVALDPHLDVQKRALEALELPAAEVGLDHTAGRNWRVMVAGAGHHDHKREQMPHPSIS
jgi:hypothetical protein